ncbi:MAG: site-specific DNA-methyltransferase [Mesorhizobium sp.]|nr:site-specific DNA-methyltransferase [Mesorhizobium sp.]MBL8578352.1 site-specific DNA-methyltransferase [Mesorhizobium sp.]
MLQIPATQNAEAHLAKAERYLSKGSDQYRLARESMKTAQRLDPEVMTNRYMAKRLGRSHRWVNALMSWDGEGTPFERRKKNVADEGLTEIDEPAIFLRENLDTILLGNHVLCYGDAENAHSKLELFSSAGLPFLKEFFDPDAIEEDDGKGFVVCTDPPYGVGKDGVTNDRRATWGEVYALFRPRGGFAFAAYKPPQFMKAQRSIEKAGWKVKHYLSMQNSGGQPWDGRVQNSIDAIFFFERKGEDVWPKRDTGTILPSLLKPSAGWTAARKELPSDHPTPKPVNVMVDLIERITEPGDIVLDPFAGSGSTLIACEEIGRTFIGIEIEGKYVQHIVRRWQAKTGKDAMVDRAFADGLISFNDLEHTPGWGDYVE